MKISLLEYRQQIKKASKTLQDLKKRMHRIKSSLQSEPANPILLREMDKISLDITITENELEHAMSCVAQKDGRLSNEDNQTRTA